MRNLLVLVSIAAVLICLPAMSPGQCVRNADGSWACPLPSQSIAKQTGDTLVDPPAAVVAEETLAPVTSSVVRGQPIRNLIRSRPLQRLREWKPLERLRQRRAARGQ